MTNIVMKRDLIKGSNNGGGNDFSQTFKILRFHDGNYS